MSKIGKRGEVWYDEIKGKGHPVVVASNDNVVVEIDHLVPTVTSKQTRNQTSLFIKEVSACCAMQGFIHSMISGGAGIIKYPVLHILFYCINIFKF